MDRPSERAGVGAWVSASDLADFAYCPRSYYYRNHPPSDGPSRAAQRSSAHGQRFHRAELTATLRAEDHRGAWLVVAAVSLLILGALAFGYFAGWWSG